MIEVIQPDIFKPLPGIRALFTLSNRDLPHKKSGIEGLNFGINTPDSSLLIENNRLQLAKAFAMDHESFVVAEQVHSDRIEVVDQPGLCKNTDGLITREPHLILAIQVADCAAIMVADIANNIIGVFHAGWRGAVHNIAAKGVSKMKVMGKNSPQFFVYISPCISKKNFEVGHEVANQFPSAFVDYVSYQKPHVDLKNFLKYELIESGVKEDRIEISSSCTMDDPGFYSYRREREKAGRMLACMYMNEKHGFNCE